MKKNYAFLAITLFIVAGIYSISINREWLPFDERLFYQETLFPIPKTFDEIFEIIPAFISNSNIESANGFFSNYLTIRSAPIAWTILIFLLFFFKTNPLGYHVFLLTIHLINTALIWFIFLAMSKNFTFSLNNKKEGNTNNLTYIIISIFTLIWALHSANTEAVLLTTNWNALLSFMLCFAFLLYEISFIDSAHLKVSKIRTILTSILFLFATSLVEQVYTFPLIIFFTYLAFSYKKLLSLKKATSIATKMALPYFIGLFLYFLLFQLKPDSQLFNVFTSNSQSLYTFLERNLWLSPQLFIHSFKLLLFPKVLSPYQSTHVHLATTLFEPYSIICICTYLFFLLFPLVMFILLKKQNRKSIWFLVYAFYFALFPFLHIIAPSYCLSADRYCYFPSFFLLLFAFTAILVLVSSINQLKVITIVLSSILCLSTARTLVRIYEWGNPYLFYKASIEAEKVPLYKAYKLSVFSGYLNKLGKQSEANESLKKSLNLFTQSLKELKKLKVQYPNQPITLKQYGLDISSLILKNAYLIATIKHDNYKEPAKDVLDFYEQYIKNNLKLAFVDQLAFYAKLLSAIGENDRAKETLEYALKKFPYSSAVLFSLAEYYLQRNEADKAYPIITKAYKYFPNDPVALSKFYKYYELKNDFLNQARFAYLLGLRNHDANSYQRAVQIYLAFRDLKNAKIALKKLIRITGETPLTILFTTNYLDLTGNKEQILPLLNKAYTLSKVQGQSENPQVTKSILASLININLYSGKKEHAKLFLEELASMKNLASEDIKQINELKKKLNGTS